MSMVKAMKTMEMKMMMIEGVIEIVKSQFASALFNRTPALTILQLMVLAIFAMMRSKIK